MLKITTHSVDETIKLGEKLAKTLKGDEVIAFLVV